MMNYITPNDKEAISFTDSRSIQNAVDLAKRTNLNKVIIPRINERTGEALWELDEAIILPSEIEIVLDNCYIRQADGSFDNVFRNFREDHILKTLDEESYGIIIRGVGNAVIDGGKHNGLTQKTSYTNGMPHVEKNNIIRFSNIREFVLENFTIKNQRWWAINLHYAEEGRISGLKIVCEGNIHNQDGIDLRMGCKNIFIENCTGEAGDDFIALTAINSVMAQKYAVEGKSTDIHDIIIKNIIATSAECTVVGIRATDGVKIYNVTVDSVYDAVSTVSDKGTCYKIFGFDNNTYHYKKSPYALLRIGQDGYGKIRECELGDVHSINVTNLHARTNTAVILNAPLENSYFGNIYAAQDCDTVISTRSCRSHQLYGAELRNIVFENIFYKPARPDTSLPFDFAVNKTVPNFENVIIRCAFIGKCQRLVNMEHTGELCLTEIKAELTDKSVTLTNGAALTVNEKYYN